MAHYALLDENNFVVNVFVGKNENEDGVNWEQFYGNHHNQTCKRTSYNTFGGSHPSGASHAFRKNYAGIGFSYDPNKDAFIPPKPFPSWTLNQTTCLWEAPISYEEARARLLDENNLPDKYYLLWNEELGDWELFNE
tara:strand:+ start:432 stop:842 length:411 start_codon:yes stop_codon:yes gene_type:complete